jgi:hypothetical protein
MEVLQLGKQAKFLQQPYYNNYHNNHIKYYFDSALHGDVCIDKPKDNSDNNQDNNNR